MTTEAIILAGGLGTRLQSVVKDIPKPMAPINDRPFLEYLFNYLIHQGIQKVVLSVGYKYEVIYDYFQNSYKGLQIEYAIEKELLGTGGGIQNALSFCTFEKVFLLNGDSFFNVNLEELYQFHMLNKSDISLSLRKMENVDRYGTLYIENQRVIKFNEKQFVEKALINGGVYLLNKQVFEDLNLSSKFSFEKDILEKYVSELRFFGLTFDEYFIDIGIPEDYARAQNELKDYIKI